jgi:hypothetical protein
MKLANPYPKYGWIRLDYNDYYDYLQALKHGNDNYSLNRGIFTGKSSMNG